MRRRLFLHSGSAAAILALTACGGGGGGGSSLASDSLTGVTAAERGPEPAPTTPATSTLPDKVLACYYTGWDTGTYKITDVPAEFNVIYLFHAKPNGTPVNGNWNNVGDGSFFFEFYADVTRAQVQTCRQRGQKVMLTVGGASAGFNFNTRAKSENFVKSFQSMYDQLGGVDGCDFNNFEANIGSSSDEMIWISRQLKAIYGDGFAITAPPQPNSAEDRAMLKAMSDAGVLTWCGPQYYDWSGFNEPGFIRNRTKDWVNDLGERKVMLGLSANYSNGPTLQDCIREWDAVKADYPNIRGMFCWSAQLNLAGGNAWGQAAKAQM
ncbi:MAG TPA: glycosyl hydrolase family 18 protein [Ramlibacter sp.]|nr:glycosyl hydrolase family 18 protein [Ramlibacter sp.]